MSASTAIPQAVPQAMSMKSCRAAQLTMPISAPAAPDRGFPVWMRLLEAATREVFEAMLGEQAAPAVYAEDDRPPVADFTALVGLSGALNGSLSIRCQSDTAYEMSQRMLGNAPDGQDEFVADALGEI